MKHEGFGILLDGTTIQHAGELLLAGAIPERGRRACAATYELSLGDVAFAIVYADWIGVPTKLQRVGEGEPGTRLVGALLDIVRPFDPGGGAPRPEELIQDSMFRQTVEADLRVISRVYDAGPYWRDLYVREAAAYMGTDPSLHTPQRDPSKYKFGRTPDYLRDGALQALCERGWIIAAREAIREQLGPSRIVDDAITEFVSCVAVTHVALFWWYEIAGTEFAKSGGVRMPHITRRLVRMVQGGDMQRKGEIREERVRVKRSVEDATRGVREAANVITRLRELREEPFYRRIRKRLGDVAGELRNQANEGTLAKLVEDIQWEGAAGTADSLFLHAPGLSGGSDTPRVWKWAGDASAPRYKALRDREAGSDPEYAKRLRGLFGL